MTEQNAEAENSSVDYWGGYGIFATFVGIALFVAMFITGAALLNKEPCAAQPLLSIYLIVQGVITVFIPILFLVKCIWRAPIPKKIIYFIFITIFVFSSFWLITGTYWLVSERVCRNSRIWKGTFGFILIHWLIEGVTLLVIGMKALIHFVRK